MDKLKVTGVRFKRADKIYDYLSEDIGEKQGDLVVVSSEKGEEIGTVVYTKKETVIDQEEPLHNIIRIATQEDLDTAANNIELSKQAFKQCQEFAIEAGLEMKLLIAEYTLDRSKLTFYYTANSRIDFRKLVRDLAKIYRTRIEMRQIGVRDATKLLGGFGICGREVCCASFLCKFDNISIKTLKEEQPSTNMNKISGLCGRLMCCLGYDKSNHDCSNCSNCETKNTEDTTVAIEKE